MQIYIFRIYSLLFLSFFAFLWQACLLCEPVDPSSDTVIPIVPKKAALGEQCGVDSNLQCSDGLICIKSENDTNANQEIGRCGFAKDKINDGCSFKEPHCETDRKGILRP